MVLKPAAMHHDVACGSDTEKTELQEVGCGPGEVSVKASATETARIDLAEAQEIWSYEEDMAFLAKASEKNETAIGSIEKITKREPGRHGNE